MDGQGITRNMFAVTGDRKIGSTWKRTAVRQQSKQCGKNGKEMNMVLTDYALTSLQPIAQTQAAPAGPL